MLAMTSSLVHRGYMVLSAFLTLMITVTAFAVLQLLPVSDTWSLRALQEDDYYCLLVPLLLSVATLCVYSNWFGYKLYRHN